MTGGFRDLDRSNVEKGEREKKNIEFPGARLAKKYRAAGVCRMKRKIHPGRNPCEVPRRFGTKTLQNASKTYVFL